MHILEMIAEPVGLTLGSFIVGLMVCIGLWDAFRRLRHRAWGPSLTLLLVPVPFFTHSLFLDMMVVFAVACAIPLWLAELSEGGRRVA